MFKNLQSFLLTLVLAGAVVLVGWWTWFLRDRLGDHRAELEERTAEVERLGEELVQRDTRIRDLDRKVVERDERIRALDIEVQRLAAENRELEAAVRLLKVDHRLARVDVLEQVRSPDDPARVITRLRFTELGVEGEPLGSGRELEVEGKVVYVETLVIKFGDQYVEEGDELRGTSICLFRRVFGEDQKPAEGPVLDVAGSRPLVYTVDGPDPFYDQLWERFWDYANDAELARSKGVRALHGEAPFMELREGKSYRLELRASGGLTFTPTN